MTRKITAHPRPVLQEGALDSRTQLPNRDGFYYDTAPVIEAQDASLVLLVIDIEGLDFILRTFGPEERDRVVHDIGDRIQKTVDSDSTPYYITQGRFAVVLAENTYLRATQRARDLVAVLEKPFNVSGIAYHLDAYVGISHYPNHAKTQNELVRTGVFACHLARGVESRFAAFDQQVDEEERRRFYLMLDLEQALEKQDEIRLAYQPRSVWKAASALAPRHCAAGSIQSWDRYRQAACFPMWSKHR